jgi:hypothetical protein
MTPEILGHIKNSGMVADCREPRNGGVATFGQTHIDRQPMARYQGKEAGNISGNYPSRHWRVDFMRWLVSAETAQIFGASRLTHHRTRVDTPTVPEKEGIRVESLKVQKRTNRAMRFFVVRSYRMPSGGGGGEVFGLAGFLLCASLSTLPFAAHPI